MTFRVRVHASSDDVYLVWRPDGPIDRCRGFAIYRRISGGKAEAIPTWVGFEDAAASLTDSPTGRPSTEWPVQKYMWTDYQVGRGQTVAYRVVPMVGKAGKLRRSLANASDWTPSVTLGDAASQGVEATFNRGIVASQWLSRRLAKLPGNTPNTKLRTAIGTVGDPLRDFLAGDARTAIIDFIRAASAAPSRALHVALFELNDPELVAELLKLGPKLHLVLANGSVKKKGEDENSDARAELKAAGIDVTDRMIAPNRLGHDKFAVLSDAAGKPMAVLTGSTNWTETGLCTQANNVLVIRDRTVAGWYRDAWQRLHDAGSATPDTLVTANSQLNTIASGGRTTSAWLTPVRKLIDLEDAARRIDAATQGVLFLMFNPGPSGTLLNTILARGDPTSPTYDRDLYVNGVLNGDPSTKKRPVVLYHRGEPSRLSFDVVLPAAVGTDPLRFWVPELKQLAGTHAMVHSKVIVVDPFGPAPVVMTGSHNMGPKASGRNDDNLVIVDGDARLAEAYAVTIISIYAQYRWRQRLAQGSKWRGLHDNDRWQGPYFQAPDLLAESRFWLGG